MKLLAIETSCDDTAIALVEIKENKKSTSFKILGNEVSSQIELHREFGGVYPSLAKREHTKNLPLVLEKVLKEAKIKMEKVNAIAVTIGPGLEPALWTGITFAEELNKKYTIPIIPTNHMEGHIFSIFPQKGKKNFNVKKDNQMLPILSLLVSGGHTELVLIKSWDKYKKIGQTRDDAVGEAFDKVARMLGLPYPGGPEISKLTEEERKKISKNKLSKLITLPRPMKYSNDYDFSFSGLKTAVLYTIRDLKKLTDRTKRQIAKEFEDAAIEVLIYKTIKAIKEYKVKNLIVGGGVSANKYLQKVMEKEIKKNKLKVKVNFPTKSLTGDNALMIAVAGYFQYKNNKFVKSYKSLKLKANGNLSL